MHLPLQKNDTKLIFYKMDKTIRVGKIKELPARETSSSTTRAFMLSRGGERKMLVGGDISLVI